MTKETKNILSNLTALAAIKKCRTVMVVQGTRDRQFDFRSNKDMGVFLCGEKANIRFYTTGSAVFIYEDD